MKKTTLKKLYKRLSQYTALSAAVAGVAEANGQESGPTTVNLDISGTTYNLDIDGDGSTEYRLNNSVPENLFLLPFEAGAEAIGSSYVEGVNTFIYPFALNSGAPISAGATGAWFNNSYQSMVASSIYGNWADGVNGVTDKYLGLRFDIAGQTHYGWAKLDVEAKSPPLMDGVFLKSYYYNPNPNDPINAGETKTLSLRPNSFEDIKIISRNRIVNIQNLINETDYRLHDITGKSILNGTTKNRIEILKVDGISPGVFVLQLRDITNGDIMSKKIIIE